MVDNLAGRLLASTTREKQAEEHARSAETKLASRDGKGCIAELDSRDKLDPRPSGLSSAPASYLAAARGRCPMLAGQCPAGKEVVRRAFEKTGGANLGPQQLDVKTDEVATQFCQGGSMSARDQYLKAGTDLELGAYMERKDAAFCMAAYNTAKRLVFTVKPKDEDDPVKFVFANVRTNAPMCLARAKDCGGALAVFKEAWNLDPLTPAASKKFNDDAMAKMFDSTIGGGAAAGCPKVGKKESWEK